MIAFQALFMDLLAMVHVHMSWLEIDVSVLFLNGANCSQTCKHIPLGKSIKILFAQSKFWPDKAEDYYCRNGRSCAAKDCKLSGFEGLVLLFHTI